MNKMVLPGNGMLLMSPVRAIARSLIHLTGLLESCPLSRPPTICTFQSRASTLCAFELLLFVASADGTGEN